MTIGITGAAGYLGANVVRHLADLGDGRHTVVPFYSRHSGNPLTDDLRLPYEHLDVTSSREVHRRTRHLDVLLHLAGRVDYSRRGARETWKVNVFGTRNVLEAAIANGIRRVVCVSSICVVGPVPPGRRYADEDAPHYRVAENLVAFRDPDDTLAAVRASLDGDWTFLRRVRVPYFDAKLAAYELARDYRRRHGMSVVCVFPGTAVGAGDTGLAIGGLVERVVEGRLRFTLPGATSFVAASDVARGIWLAARRGRPGSSFIVSGRDRDNLRYADFMALVARVARERFGRRPPRHFIRLPAGPARWVAAIAETVSPQGPLSRGLVLSGSMNHHFTSRRAARDLGYRPRQRLEDAVAECIAFNNRLREGS